MLACKLRTALIVSSKGDFVFWRMAAAFQNSGAETIVSNTSFISPFFFKKVAAILSTKVCGGLSLTKRTAILCEINFAVAGF